MDFADLRSALDDLAGLDLDETHRDALINEGYAEICVRAEWLRGEVELGPGVDDTATYAIPSNVYRVLNLDVNGYRYKGSNREEINRVTLGNSWLAWGTEGLWYNSYSDTGTQLVGVYPTPATGDTLSALCVLRPDPLTDPDDVPLLPPEFHRTIADFAAAIAFGTVEDNADLRSYHIERVDQKVAELRRLRFSTGRETMYLGRNY